MVEFSTVEDTLKRYDHYKECSLHDRSLSREDPAAKIVTDVYLCRFLGFDVVLISIED